MHIIVLHSTESHCFSLCAEIIAFSSFIRWETNTYIATDRVCRGAMFESSSEERCGSPKNAYAKTFAGPGRVEEEHEMTKTGSHSTTPSLCTKASWCAFMQPLSTRQYISATASLTNSSSTSQKPRDWQWKINMSLLQLLCRGTSWHSPPASWARLTSTL